MASSSGSSRLPTPAIGDRAHQPFSVHFPQREFGKDISGEGLIPAQVVREVVMAALRRRPRPCLLFSVRRCLPETSTAVCSFLGAGIYFHCCFVTFGPRLVVDIFLTLLDHCRLCYRRLVSLKPMQLSLPFHKKGLSWGREIPTYN